MKRFLIPFCVAAVGFTTVVGLYTEDQLNSLTNNLVPQFRSSAVLGNRDVDLAQIIRTNHDAVMESDWVSWEVNSERFATWKANVIANPELGRAVIKTLGPILVQKINAEAYANVESMKSRMPDLEYDEVAFWNRQREHVGRYKRLVQAMLALKDAEMNDYMSTGDMPEDDIEAFKSFNQFLESKGLVNSASGGPSSNYWAYPGDLILLVKRCAESSDDMSYRQGFEVALSYIEAVESILPA